MKDHRNYSECILSSHSCEFKVPDPVFITTTWMPAGVANCASAPLNFFGREIKIEEKKEIYQIIVTRSSGKN
jgi:hypothetical protein